MPLPAEVFLSHATPDRRFADRLATVVRAHGVPIWYSRTDLLGSQQWHDEIGHALARCDAFIVVLSPAAVASQWVKFEFRCALADPRYRTRITPVLLAPCDTKAWSWTLDAIQRVDFTGEFDLGCRDLMRVQGLGYAPPAKKPGRHRPAAAGPKRKPRGRP